MKLLISINGVETSVLMSSVSIVKQLNGRSSTASFTLAVRDPEALNLPEQEAEVIIYIHTHTDSTGDGTAFWFNGLPLTTLNGSLNFWHRGLPTDNVTGATDPNVRLFRGFVTSTEIDQKSGTLQLWKLTCTGIEYLLENVTINRTWTGLTDREIIQDAFGSVLPEISTDNSTVDELLVAIDFQAKDLTLRELLDQLAQLSGADWRVTEQKALSYHASGSIAVAYTFGDRPNI